MPRLVVRKGYRCQPGKRRDLLAALQRLDAAAAEAGWPRGRYLLVETRTGGEPDVEVEFTFESYAAMEQTERRLREHLARAAREGGAAVAGAGQEFLLEPSTTRYLTLLDNASTAAGRRPNAGAAPVPPPASPTPPPTPAPGTAPPQAGRSAAAAPSPDEDDEEFPDEDFEELEDDEGPPPPPPAPLTPEQRLRQLGEARAALDNAERAVNLPADRRASGRGPLPQPPPRRRQPEE
jgi:hypothetical protein